MSFLECPDGSIEGTMPNGDKERFDSVEDYEDAYWDAYFLESNEFELEIPEYA